MKVSYTSRALALMLAVLLLFGSFSGLAYAEPPEEENLLTDYGTFLSALTVLEDDADRYALEHAGEDPIALVINYIRTGVEKYNTGTWNTFCGEEKTAFTAYVAEQDAYNGTNAQCLRNLGEFTLPNGDIVEFSHMFGCMDMAYHTGNQNTADLGSWAGDICDLVQLTHNGGVTGSVEEMAELIRTDNEHYFLYDDPEAHSFGIRDYYGDLDAYYILSRVAEGNTISRIMRSYFTTNLNESFRAAYFLEHRLDGARTKIDIRSAVYEIYSANEGIHTLEGTYLPDGVNPDLRRACCYAFADHLYLNARDMMENPYYVQFSREASRLAPGVTQEIKMAMTQDDKQIVYYLAKADVGRDDVHVFANYGENDASTWKMTRVTDQMAAAQQKHSNPEDEEHFIPNYNAVVGVNADFYNMSTGVPTGVLVMEGVTYNEWTRNNFFAVLDDGTPVIGGKAEYEACKDRIREAVGGSIWLVRDGKIAVTSTSNYYTDRASRTCVGITYDGQVVVMALDGRQEPFSAGGSSIEIAQIMLDAGCVTAINLDGGGSTTFAARAEGSEEIALVNRPSDGYERSVSSSLLVVSTAKPSNVFDHAVVSADYDYLTVGTALEIRTAGVTATGGAIALPEGATLQVSDESIGTVADGVFTAAAQGDVQVCVVSDDGRILGSKTLHVVEPTQIQFSRDSMNAVYGQSVELPVEASYNGNVVKISPDDIQFGFIKLSLQSIGTVEGADVNTTRTELVYSYPEAGTVDGLTFTVNEESSLRTLTIGAVLKSKLGEFQTTVRQEYNRVYQEAREKGYTNREAALQAETAAINKALSTAARMEMYFYDEDEANFDFDSAHGTTGLLSWRRDVPHTAYRDELNTYYLLEPDEEMIPTYTFAVDMSKAPIPEQLTGLLYMLPGGDQEGRTAWDFLLQLAERISPLTTINIEIRIPEGFTADVEDLTLVNEYFEMTDVRMEEDLLRIQFNYILQTEPISPTMANPLCVLSGLRLIPEADAPWDADNCLDVSLSGSMNYDIYAHFHILKSLAAQEEYQVQYGLFPYDNSANIPLDYGAHFASSDETLMSFSDSFRLNRFSKDGWVRENGGWYYYENGTLATGIRRLPTYDPEETGDFWYDLGDTGLCTGKLTGIFSMDGERYYSRMGELVTGWQSIADAGGESYFYYFDPADYTMYTGVRDVRGLTYTFDENGRMIRGAFRTNAAGTKYFVAGESQFRRFVTLEEGTYWLDVNGYVAHGNAYTVTTNIKDITWYHFDEQTGLLTGLCSGFFEYEGERYYCDENGKVFYGAIGTEEGIVFSATRGKLYVNQSCYIDATTSCRNCTLETGKYWCGPDGLIQRDGFAEIEGSTYYFTDYVRAKGLQKIGEDYYLFNAGNGKMYKDAKMWVGANDCGIQSDTYYFGPDGKMFIPDLVNGKRAIITEGGVRYFTIDGVKMNGGLYELDGEYYYAQKNGVLITDRTVWIDQKNGLIPEKGEWYRFDTDSRLVKTGFVDGGDGETYYYKDTVLALGLQKIDGEYYFFNTGSGKLQRDKTLWIGQNDYGFASGTYYFDANGRMFLPDLVNGNKSIVEQNGKRVFLIDGIRMNEGLYEMNGEYYYVKPNGTLATDEAVIVSRKNGLIPAKGEWYYFDRYSVMQKTGDVIANDGEIYYYVDTVLALGLLRIGEDYCFFNMANGKLQRNRTLWVGANDYGFPGGMYQFDEVGRMILPDLSNGKKAVVEENGKRYFTINGIRMTDGLYELDGDCYCARYDGVLVTDAAARVTRKNGLIPEKGLWYSFDAESKLRRTGFVRDTDGECYYYEDAVLALGLKKIGEDYYFFNLGSGKLQRGRKLWVGANAYGVPTGMHTFDADGKMVD